MIIFTGDIPDHSLKVFYFYETINPVTIISNLFYDTFPNIS